MAKPAVPIMKAADLLAQVAPDREARAEAHRAEQQRRRDEHRARFPAMAEMVDMFRAADAADPAHPFNGRPVHAMNEQGASWGQLPDQSKSIAVDGDKLAHLTEYQSFWQRFYAKKAENNATYGAGMQRSIRPTRGNE
jgi:hypothetical protein